jgi:hypothetical protein
VPGTKEYDHIYLILKQAESHGLKWEVEDYVKRQMLKTPNLLSTKSLVEVYQDGYNEWVK